MEDSLQCFVCNGPSEVIAEMPYGMQMPACKGCFLEDDAPCGSCGHPVIDHVGVPGPGLPEQALLTDCDFDGCDCRKFLRPPPTPFIVMGLN